MLKASCNLPGSLKALAMTKITKQKIIFKKQTKKIKQSHYKYIINLEELTQKKTEKVNK